VNGLKSGWRPHAGAEATRTPAFAEAAPSDSAAKAIPTVEPMRSFRRRESKRFPFLRVSALRAFVGAGDAS